MLSLRLLNLKIQFNNELNIWNKEWKHKIKQIEKFKTKKVFLHQMEDICLISLMLSNKNRVYGILII